jgi:ribonuclease P/MRP protein subunit RPP1
VRRGEAPLRIEVELLMFERRAVAEASASGLTRERRFALRSMIGYRTFVVDARVEAEEGVTSADALRRAAAEANARNDAETRSRCTIAFGDPSALQHVLGACKSELAKFDVLALEPTSERAFSSACASKHADVVSVRAGGKLRYRFAASDVHAALKNKIWFELCYGEALRDSTSRMWFFANAAALARATRGGRDGVILSSGVDRAIDVRSMHDVVNLATLFGMRERDARAAMTTQPHEMIALAGKRRRDAAA